MKQRKTIKKSLLSILLSFIMVLGLIPGMSLTANAEETHMHNGVTFEKWESTDSLPSTAGSYYLTQDVTLTRHWVVPTGGVDLCLNGHNITSDQTGTNKMEIYTTAKERVK